MLAYLNPANLITALIAINFITFAAFGIDKARAETGGWRIRESTLLKLAFFGGMPGAFAGRAAFRHKTRKQPFCDNLFSIVYFHAFVLGLVGWHFAVGF